MIQFYRKLQPIIVCLIIFSVLIALTALIIKVWSILPIPEERIAIQQAAIAEQEIKYATDGISNIRYIKDNNTGNCFALLGVYSWPALATVDCATLQNVDVVEN